LKAYIVYGKNYDSALNMLQEVGTNQHFKSFVKVRFPHMLEDDELMRFVWFQSATNAANSLKEVQEYLTDPMDRMSYYEDTLQQILAKTPYNHLDHHNLSNALEKINALSIFLTEKVK
jgi:hypothetical protein